jgi:two-component system LytT family response regulator
MKVLILEDEERTARHLEELIHRYDKTIQVLATLPSVTKASDWLMKNDAPQLIFMDIHLEDALVFRLFEKIRITTPVIFTTAYDEYMIQAFKVNSIDYLLKPVQLPELQSALDKYQSLQKHFTQINYQTLVELIGNKTTSAYKDRFMITAGNRITTVDAKNIACFFLEAKATYLFTDKGQRLVVSYSLDELSQCLDPRLFFRVNRQCIISHSSIRNAYSYSPGKLKVELQPAAPNEIFVSGDRMNDFKVWLGK